MPRAVEALLPSHVGLALRLLSTAPDVALGEMLADRSFVQKVDAAIPPADRQPFYEERFGASREEVEAGAARPREMYPAGFFNPGMLSPDLADLPVSAEVTPEQARVALHGRGEAELTRALAGLSPPEAARAAWWIVQARESAGWQHQALAYLAGDWAVRLTAGQQRELVVALVTGRPSPDEVWLALALLRAAHDDDLRIIVDQAGELLAMLEEAIPAGDSLREELETFLRQRFGGRDELAAGRWVPRGQLPGLFIPALLDNSLRGLAPDVEPSEAALDLIEAAIGRLGRQKLTALLMKLPQVERARAARWLTAVRVALHTRGATRPEVMAMIDQTRDVLYRAAARDVPDADRLSQVTRTPPAEQMEALRRVLDPVPDTADGQAQPFTNRLPEQEEDFADRLAEAFDSAIESYTGVYVDNRRAEDRVAGNLDSIEDMWRIVEDAQKRIDKTFGHLKQVHGWDGIRIYDQWEYADQQIKGMSDTGLRELARSELMKYLNWPNRVAEVMREHHAVPRFDQLSRPANENEEARIIRAVIEGLLDREGTMDRVLDIYRGSLARARSETKEMWFQLFRPRGPRARQRARWETEIGATHELLHLLEHWRYKAFRMSLGLGSQAGNTLGEGSVTLFTENVWPGVRPRRTVRLAVEGELADEPPLPPDEMPHPGQSRYQYRSIEQIMRLIHLVGDIRNLYAAFFLGEVEKIAGPISLAVMGSPEAPLPAGEVAALVARLNALPPGERERLRISVITDASQPEITRLLTGPGADVLAVWAVEPARRAIAWNGETRPTASGRRPRLAGRAGDGAWLDNAWAAGRQQLSELAARLAGRTDGDVEDVSEALARYARARFDRTAAVDALAAFRGSPDGSSSPLPREQRLAADVRRAQDELTKAHDRLVAAGVADPGRAWRKVARLLARLAGRGLPGGGPRREQFKRRRPSDASPPVPVRRPRLASPPQTPQEVRAAEQAAERVVRYLGGDLGTGLDEVAGQRALLFSLLAGSRVAGAGWRRVALLLLAVADDRLLGELFGDGGELLVVLLAAIPAGDPLRGELDELLDRRVAGGWRALAAGTAAPSGQPPEVFSPEFLSAGLASVGEGPERTLSEEDVGEVIEEMAMADVEAMVGQFRGLPVVQRARGGRWLGAASARIQSRLVAAESAAAGEAPGDVDEELETMRAALRTAEDVLNWVYLDSAAQIPDATAAVFALGGGAEVTQGHLDGLARLRAGLAAEPRAATRAAQQAAEQVARYLGGDLGTGLDEVAQQRAALWPLLAGPALADAGWRRVALALLRAADDWLLGELFADGGELLVVLLAAIPASDPLRGELDDLLDRRVAGGWRALAAGSAAPSGQPPEVFSPEFLSEDLAGVGAGSDGTLSQEDVGEVTVVMALADLREMTERLGLLPVVQRARAGRWLLSARVQIHSRFVATESAAAARKALDTMEQEALATMRAALRNIEVVLNWLYLDAAAQVQDAAALSQRAAIPKADKVAALRAALDPATEVIPAVAQGSRAQGSPAEDARAGPAPAGPSGVGPGTGASPAWEAAFRAALHTVYGQVIARLWETSVQGRGPEDRQARGLHSMERVGQVAQEVKWWFDQAFGQFVTVPAAVPDQPDQPGNIHDQFVYADERINAMTESESRERAASEMRSWLYGAEPLAKVLAAHQVNPVFGYEGVPPNEQARMVDAVIEDILSEPGRVRQVLEIWRGWPGYEKTATGEVFIQTIRAATPRGNQVFWWAHTWTQFHETAHRLQHPELLRYAAAVGGAGENTLVEGLACWVSELAAAPMMPHVRERWLRERIEGEFASERPLDPAAMPSLAPGKRYPSYTEVMKLLHVVGNPFNVLMAFFYGRIELITGPLGVALMGSPEAPLPAGEIAAVVTRLNALSPAERHGLRVSVYTEAPRQMIEDLLTEPGAEVLTVWTARPRATGAEPRQLGSTGVPGPHEAGMLLSESELGQLVGSAVESVRGRAAVGSVFADCVALLGALARELYPVDGPLPGGVSAGRVVDDGVLGAEVEQSLAPGASWQRVSSWTALAKAVEAAGPGATGLVLWQRRTGAGHAFAVHRAAEGVRWIELQAGTGARLSADPPRHAAVDARAVVVDRWGQVVDGGLAPLVQSESTALALIDPPASRRYGAIGVEIETRWRLDGGAEPLEYGDVLFRSQYVAAKVESVLGRWSLMEIEIGPMDVVSGDHGFDAVDDAFQSAALVLGRLREETPLASLFSPGDGFTVEGKGVSTRLTSLLGRHQGAELFLSPQYTVGVPMDGLPELLGYALRQSDRALPSMFADLNAAPAFADEIVAWFAADAGVPASADVPAVAAGFLSGEDYRDLKGYAELIFIHAMAPVHRAADKAAGRPAPPESKMYLAAASRHAPHVLRQELSAAVQDFLSRRAVMVKRLFVSFARVLAGPGFTASPLTVEFEEGYALVEDYLDNALLSDPDIPVVPRDFSIVTAFGSLDRNPDSAGNTRRDKPLVLIELRSLPVVYGVGQLRAQFNHVAENVLRISAGARERRMRPQQHHQSAAERIASLAAVPAVRQLDLLLSSVSRLKALLSNKADEIDTRTLDPFPRLLADKVEQLARIGPGNAVTTAQAALMLEAAGDLERLAAQLGVAVHFSLRNDPGGSGESASFAAAWTTTKGAIRWLLDALEPITGPRAPVPSGQIIERWRATSSALLARRSPGVTGIDTSVGALLQAREDPARLVNVLAAIHLWRKGKRDPSASVRGRAVADLERRVVREMLALSPVPPSGVNSEDGGERPDFGGFGALSRSSSQVSGDLPIAAEGSSTDRPVSALLEEPLWARYAGEWSAVLDGLAEPGAMPPRLEEQPEGFPPDRATAFASYAQARSGHHAAARELAEAKAHAEPGPAAARELREQARAAARRLAMAKRWLAAWGITDAELAWEEAQAFSAQREG